MSGQSDYPRILSVDAAPACSGLVVLDRDDTVRTSRMLDTERSDRANRLMRLARSVQWCCTIHVPDVVAIEDCSQRVGPGRGHFVDVSVAHALGEAFGAVVAGVAWSGINVRFEFATPQAVKEGIYGYSDATKEQVAQALQLRGYTLPLVDGRPNLHLSDALALAALVRAEWPVRRLQDEHDATRCARPTRRLSRAAVPAATGHR